MFLKCHEAFNVALILLCSSSSQPQISSLITRAAINACSALWFSQNSLDVTARAVFLSQRGSLMSGPHYVLTKANESTILFVQLWK